MDTMQLALNNHSPPSRKGGFPFLKRHGSREHDGLPFSLPTSTTSLLQQPLDCRQRISEMGCRTFPFTVGADLVRDKSPCCKGRVMTAAAFRSLSPPDPTGKTPALANPTTVPIRTCVLAAGYEHLV
jgi:hypothetical protein